MNNESTTEHKTFPMQPSPTPTETTTPELCTPTPPQTNNQPSDSSTVVNFDLGEPRKTVGFKCNINLWNAFVPYCKANYGSVCHVLEPVIVALLTSRVNLSKTLKPLHIENLNVERAVRRVRRYAVEKEAVVNVGKCVVCGKPGFARAIDGDGERVLCELHLQDVKRKLLGWKVLEGST